MTRILKPLFLLLVAVSFLASCDSKTSKPKDTVYYNLSGAVKTTLHSFDYSNLEARDESFSPESIKLTFNRDGMLEETVSSYIEQANTANKQTIMTSKFQYDDQGRLKTQYDRYDSDQPQVISFLYREEEFLPYASTMFDGHETQMTNLSHDTNGNMISAVSVSESLETKSQYSAKYSDINQLVERSFTYGDSYQSSITITYNSDRTVKSETTITGDDKSVLTYEYLKTDSVDNWIERKVMSSDKDGYVIEKRTINYF